MEVFDSFFGGHCRNDQLGSFFWENVLSYAWRKNIKDRAHIVSF